MTKLLTEVIALLLELMRLNRAEKKRATGANAERLESLYVRMAQMVKRLEDATTESRQGRLDL